MEKRNQAREMPNKRAVGWRYALSGIMEVLNEFNFRVHVLAGAASIAVGLFLQIAQVEWLFVASAIAAVWITETLNTAIERVVDLCSPQIHPLARKAKDLGAAAVLFATLYAVVVGVLVFGKYVT